jgi:hypothetical protein
MVTKLGEIIAYLSGNAADALRSEDNARVVSLLVGGLRRRLEILRRNLRRDRRGHLSRARGAVLPDRRYRAGPQAPRRHR